jgi:hypothetical protein
MSTVANIRIELSNGYFLDYKRPEDLGIKFNRIVDDYNNPTKRFGEFSYTFNLPRTKNNDEVFEYPDVKGRVKIFVGKKFECRVFNHSTLLLDGILELTGINAESYNCIFYSKVSQLFDDLRDKSLNEMTYLPTIDWDFENTIAEHIKVAPVSEHIEFPLIFYKTPFMSGATNANIAAPSGFPAEAHLGYYYNYVLSTLPFKGQNPLYEAALPPAIYLKSIMDGIFSDAGWTYNSTLFQRADIQKIIIPFTGNGEDFSGSIISGTTGYTLNINKLLPDIPQIEFLKTVIDTFNLYFIVNNEDKSITLEPYSTLFRDLSNPYPINVFNISKRRIDDTYKITLEEDDTNSLALGFGRIMDYSAIANNNPTYNVNTCIDIRLSISKPRITTTYKKDAYNKLWNKTTGTKEIKIDLTPCNYYPYTIINERSIGNATTSVPQLWTVGIPLISPQTPQDNDGNFYAEDTDTNYVEGNDPNNFNYDGGLKFLYYYGKVNWNPPLIGGGSLYKEWVWFGLATGGTVTVPTFANVPVCIASPFRLISQNEFNTLKSNITSGAISTEERITEKGAEVHSVLLTYFGAASFGGNYEITNFNLTFGENTVYDNLYTVFHKPKFDDMENGYVLSGTMRMDENDWREMQINRPLLFNDELYRLVAIKNYDPVTKIAQIEMIRKT